MERHKCKLCTRSFANGRALGGHMKAHLATLPLPKKTQQFVDSRIESAASASLEEEEEEENRGGGEQKGLVYGLRENPKKSFRVADPEFSFVADPGSCVVVQDGESETESRNPTRRRSKRKRNRKFENQKMKFETKKAKQSSKQSWINNNNNEYNSSPADPEPVSSVSDTSPEEDVATCLMMLSRDCWMKEQDQRSVEKSKVTKKIRCEKCNQGFRSLHALDGHKRICEQGKIAANDKIFECPFCFKVFGSGQALGGHKRSHILSSSTSTATTTTPPPTKLDTDAVSVSIDLNLPAPVDEDDEYSVVSEK